jgi:hypothetical protein
MYRLNSNPDSQGNDCQRNAAWKIPLTIIPLTKKFESLNKPVLPQGLADDL